MTKGTKKKQDHTERRFREKDNTVTSKKSLGTAVHKHQSNKQFGPKMETIKSLNLVVSDLNLLDLPNNRGSFYKMILSC